MTAATPPEPTRLAHWLRRLWPVYCFLAALVTFGYAIYDGYQIDGDAVAYMDIGDLMRSHQWAGINQRLLEPPLSRRTRHRQHTSSSRC